MKNVKRIIKGIVLSTALAMVLSVSLDIFLPDHTPFAARHAFAYEGDVCDNPLDGSNTNFNQEACDAKIAEDKAKADAAAANAPSTDTIDGVLMADPAVPPETPQTAKSKEDFTVQIARLATYTHRIFAPLINFFAFQVGNFLGTDYIYSGPMGDMLHKIWVISRNLVNISFVFLLLWMALKEIFYVDQESELKKNMIKFVLLLVAVNFSWLGTKVVLDAANVVTHVVFAIPSGISDPPNYGTCTVNADNKSFTGSCYPTTILAPADAGATAPYYWETKEGSKKSCDEIKQRYSGPNVDGAAYTAEGERNPHVSETNKRLQGRTSICMENLNLVKYDQNTAVIYLTYGMARIQNLVAATASADLDDLAVGTVLSLVIQLAYSIALLALFIALVIRMAMLWFFIGFSPFLVLVIWFSGAEDQDFGDFKFGIKEFANWAFVPAKVGAIFAVSFIMISAGQAAGEVSSKIFDTSKVKSGLTFEIFEVKSIFGSIGSLQTFIWLLMSLVVLWLGTFAVLSKMSIVNKITDRIRDAGNKMGELVGTSPYWAPVLPLGKGGDKASVQSLWQGVNPISKLEAYKGDTKGQEVRELQKRARAANLSSQANRMLEAGATESVQRNIANQIAGKLGFRNVAELFRTHKNKDTVVAALKAAKVSDDQAGTVYDAMKKFEREEGAKQAERIGQATARAQTPTPTPPQTQPPAGGAGGAGGTAGGGAAGGGAAGGGAAGG